MIAGNRAISAGRKCSLIERPSHRSPLSGYDGEGKCSAARSTYPCAFITGLFVMIPAVLGVACSAFGPLCAVSTFYRNMYDCYIWYVEANHRANAKMEVSKEMDCKLYLVLSGIVISGLHHNRGFAVFVYVTPRGHGPYRAVLLDGSRHAMQHYLYLLWTSHLYWIFEIEKYKKYLFLPFYVPAKSPH